jgi:NADP-dependent 3-hydroxy acid dehydrogenase YdfG
VSGALAGRSALVTGASRGIGAAIAAALAGAGARVALVARDQAALGQMAKRLAGSIAVPCDLTDDAAVNAAVESVRAAFGDAPDIIVNDAGLWLPSRVAEAKAADLRDTLAVNVVAPFVLTRLVLPRMLERKSGHIVTIGSTADRHAFPDNGTYSASRYGARGLHEVLREELRGTGVRTTLVSPGSTDTTIWDKVAGAAPGRFPPRSAMLAVENVAAAVLFAVSQPATVNVDELRLTRA